MCSAKEIVAAFAEYTHAYEQFKGSLKSWRQLRPGRKYNSGSRADGNRKQRGSRSLTAKRVIRMLSKRSFSGMTIIALLGLMYAPTVSASSPVQDDDEATIFVRQPGASDDYVSVSGTIRVLTPSYLIIDTSGTEHLYTREAVKFVKLDHKSADGLGLASYRRRLIESYWNSDYPVIVQIVQGLPVVGQSLGFLTKSSPSTASLIASLLLVGTLGWGTYKIYEIFVVARESQRLNRVKLHFEIAKARYEALALSKDAAPRERLALESIETPLMEDIHFAASNSPSRHTISRLSRFILPQRERELRSRIYKEEWRIRLEEGLINAKKALRRKLLVRRLGLALLWLYGPLLLISPFIMILAQPRRGIRHWH
jgi:hypothetical protein